MKYRWWVLTLLSAGFLCAPLFVGCGPSFKSEAESRDQLKKEAAAEAKEADVVKAEKAAAGEGDENDDEALNEPDIP
jgi:hypothetical protein